MPDDGFRSGMLREQGEGGLRNADFGFRGIVCDGEDKGEGEAEGEVKVEVKVEAEVEAEVEI